MDRDFGRRCVPDRHVLRSCSISWRCAELCEVLPIDQDLISTSLLHPITMASVRSPSALLGSFRTTSRRSATVWRQQCCYHSHEYSQPPPFPPAETAILSSALTHVPNYGFTADALRLGARDAGYMDVSTNLLPRGVFDLVNYHLVTQRLALKNTVQFPPEEPGKKLGIGAKVRTLTLARLRANEPIIHRWQEVR